MLNTGDLTNDFLTIFPHLSSILYHMDYLTLIRYFFGSSISLFHYSPPPPIDLCIIFILWETYFCLNLSVLFSYSLVFQKDVA